MNWLNLNTKFLHSPEYIGSEPTARATWLNVLAFCVGQENGGRIVGCEAWKSRQWQQTCGVTVEEINASSPLLTWDGSDLVIWSYPTYSETVVQRKREGGRRGGFASSEARSKHSSSTSSRTASKTTASTPSTSAATERERERERERECSQSVAPAPAKQTHAPAPDSEWLATIAASPAFAGIDVPREIAKAKLWAESNRRKFTRRFALSWLNRAEKPMTSTHVAALKPKLLDECIGWKVVLAENFPDSVFGPGQEREAGDWSELSIDAQRAILACVKSQNIGGNNRA